MTAKEQLIDYIKGLTPSQIENIVSHLDDLSILANASEHT